MRLERVEIFGFKSFPQRTEIAFDRGITGIVGPNGSGKSNIADAIRWVLGEQSPRTLRGARMEDVIFSGTESKRALPYCEVSLDFENTDRALDSDYAHVRITRRAYRSGDSEYLLNKTPCRLRDILNLFRDTGIGREGYSIIGQGRIDEILSPRSEERRQAFEEAVGIATFRDRKEEAERKLQKTREHLCRVGDILAEIETSIDTLREQAEKAQRFLNLSERLRFLDANLYLGKRSRLEGRLASVSRTRQAASDAVLALDGRMEALKGERGALEEEKASLDEEIDRVRKEADALKDAHAQSLARTERTRLQMDGARRELQLIREEAGETEGRLSALREASGDSKDEGARLAKALIEAERELELANDRLSKLQKEEEGLGARLEETQERLMAAMNRLSDAKSGQARRLGLKAQVEQGVIRYTQTLEIQAREQDRLGEALGLAEAQALQSERCLRQDEAALAEKETALKKAAARLEEASAVAAGAARNLEGQESRLRTLSELSREHEGYADPVRQALAFARGDPGVYGAVARLIRVPGEYETAVDVALGSALQNIVTSSEEPVRRIIRHLRDQRLGRVTFLPLNALRPRRLSRTERELLSRDGCIGVASELIGIDEALRPVADHLLGRTVIVRDLDTGIALSRASGQAFHVVNLEGDILRAGGAITGGAARRAGPSLLGREREIESLREQVAKLRENLRGLTGIRDEAGSALDRARADREEAFARLQEQRIAVERDRERMASARTELESGAGRLQELHKALEQLRLTLEETQADLDAARAEETSGVERIEALRAEAKDLQQKTGRVRTDLDAQREKVSALSLRRSALAHEQDVLNRDAGRRKQEEEKLKTALERHEKRRLGIEAGLEADADRLERELRTAQEGGSLAGLKAERLESLLEEARARSGRLQEQGRETEELHRLRDAETEKLRRSEVALVRIEAEIRALAEGLSGSHGLSHEDALALKSDAVLPAPEAEEEASEIRTAIRELGSVNPGAVEEYARTRVRYEGLLAQREDAAAAEGDLVRLIRQLLSAMEEQFRSGFERLNQYFSQTFARLFGGGKAFLRLVDEADPLSCDIEIAAQPQGKKLQLLSLLSSGERALTAIAILFAMLKLKPTPFCVLDEIEAALDEANIGYFADYLAEFAKTTQFIVITHRKGTMQRCDTLYGVTMEEKGVSGMVSVDLRQYDSVQA